LRAPVCFKQNTKSKRERSIPGERTDEVTADMQKSLVLIIANESPLRDALETGLLRSGCSVITAHSIELAVQRAVVYLPKVVVVVADVNGEESSAICSRIRSRMDAANTPVFVMAPDAEDVESVSDQGESHGRLVDLTRFTQGLAALASSTNESQMTASHVHVQGLHMDRDAFRVSLLGRELQLTLTEFNILWRLARSGGAVLTRQKLCDECSDDDADRQCRSVDVHIRSLRKKLDDHASLIETVRGVGYRINDRSDSADPASADGQARARDVASATSGS
jgi:two-component system phosphate regulon response regulator PhoB